mmetsp:Transcript_56066/g.135576  ORF Transcript_56066/g.135576 Transcript_56066/m.135576 type:complete len:132 (-) Transcript_56066:33-428(-)
MRGEEGADATDSGSVLEEGMDISDSRSVLPPLLLSFSPSGMVGVFSGSRIELLRVVRASLVVGSILLPWRAFPPPNRVPRVSQPADRGTHTEAGALGLFSLSPVQPHGPLSSHLQRQGFLPGGSQVRCREL